MLVANEITLNDYSISGVNSYTTSSILTGSLIRMYTDLSGSTYLSPMEYNYARPYEQTGRFSDWKNISVVNYSNDIDYILSTEGGLTGATTGVRRILMMAFDKSKNEWIESGGVAISCSFDLGAVNKARSIGAVDGHFYRYSTGTVQVNGLGVTGSSTNWATNRIFQGSRIKFGTADYTVDGQWYEIATVPTQDRLELVNTLLPLATYPAGTPYVIEEMKLITPVRHITGSFNGLMVINGVTRNSFNSADTLFDQYSSSLDDRKKGYYLIRDGNPSGSIQTPAFPVTFEPNPLSPTEHYAYSSEITVLAGTAPAVKYFKYDVNKPVSQSIFFSGAVTESFIASTERSAALGGASLTAGLSMPIASIGHGSRSGSLSLYHYARGGAGLFRIFQIPLDGTAIYSGSTNYLNTSTLENPPGSQETNSAIGISSLAYVSSIDKFIVAPGFPTGFGRFAMIKFNDRINENARYGTYALGTRNRFTSVIGDDAQPKHAISNGDVVAQIAASADILYVSIGVSTAAIATSAGALFAIPIACDWETAPTTKQWVTFPPIATPNAISYSTIYTKSPAFLGSDTLGFAPERMVIYYRTTGISDDSGEWKRVPNDGNLSTITIADQIQFSIAFDVFGTFGLYNRLHGICFTYNDNQQDDHYQASLEESNIANNQIVWIQAKQWNSAIPNLKINIFNNLNNSLVIDDTTAAQTQGIFEYSVNNGVTYLPWDSSQDAIGNRIRYTATTLPANTNIKIILNKK